MKIKNINKLYLILISIFLFNNIYILLFYCKTVKIHNINISYIITVNNQTNKNK